MKSIYLLATAVSYIVLFKKFCPCKPSFMIVSVFLMDQINYLTHSSNLKFYNTFFQFFGCSRLCLSCSFFAFTFSCNIFFFFLPLSWIQLNWIELKKNPTPSQTAQSRLWTFQRELGSGFDFVLEPEGYIWKYIFGLIEELGFKGQGPRV